MPWGATMALSVVVLASAAMCLTVGWAIRGITFFGVRTDNEKQVRIAARAGEWRWPSDMHKYIEEGLRTRMKDSAMLGLVIMQRLLRDRATVYPQIMLCIAANTVSAVLIFIIAQAYWTTSVGVFLFVLVLTSFWPYQIALYGGYHCISQMFLLAAVYCLQQVESAASLPGAAWLWASGALATLMLFASSASRKFVPFFFAAFLFSQHGQFSPLWWGPASMESLLDGFGPPIIVLVVLLTAGLIFCRLTYGRIVRAVYEEHGPGWLNRMIKQRGRRSLEHYIEEGREYLQPLMTLGYTAVLYLVVNLFLTRSTFFYVAQLTILLGGISVILFLTYPHVVENLWRYYAHARLSKWNHFRCYFDYFAKVGKPIPEDMRGAGLVWVIRFLWRVVPFHIAFYLICLAILTYIHLVKGAVANELWKMAGIVGLSLSPLAVGELTRGTQIGRSYFPGFVGLLLFIGYGAFQFTGGASNQARIVFWWAVTAGLVAGAAWNLWVLVDDVWPARMAPAWLGRKLDALGITEFYTYDMPYNHAFVDALRLQTGNRYKIHVVDRLDSVKRGYVVVPGTSAKAVNMESESYAIENGDFESDPVLNGLIESKLIEQYSVASFKTFGTSRMWLHESEVTSYRDLILGEITEADRYRGRAWILDLGKLHANRRREDLPNTPAASALQGVGSAP